MSLDRLNQLITKTAKVIYDSEKFSIDVLAVRAQKVAQSCPTDQTLVGMANFLTKRATSSSASFITRSELKDVYNKLYTPNNKFVVAFSEELGIKEAIKPKGMNRDPNEGKNLVEGAYEKLADPILSNALSSIFEPNAVVKMYSNATAKSAQKSCAYELSKQGATPKKIDIVAGQSDILICQATYDTPKGESHVLIPVEIKQQSALLPTMFLSTAGFVDLNAKLLEQHLLSTAGKSYKINVQKVLEVIATAKNGSPEPLSEVERIVIKASSSNGSPSYDPNGILYQEVDQPVLDVVEDQYEQPEEVQAFAQRLTSTAGIAEFTLGKNVVSLGRNLVQSLLSKFGYKNVQLAVADSNENTIFYAVAIDSDTGFKVPVKVEKSGKVHEPGVIIADGKIREFSKLGISQLLSEGIKDHKTSMMASPMYNLKPTELIGQIKSALNDSNYHKAEDALDILRSCNDEKAFRIGYELYTQALSNNSGGLKKEAQAHQEKCCERQYKTANSKYVICGHTNLPVHKVYQDKNGDCQPLYRKDMSETSEGASFLHSKIYMG
jgi:hypothetical protein